MSPRTSELICSRVERLDALPTIPTVVISLLHYLEQPVEQLEGQQVADPVSCDPTLAAQCLRVANAPSLGRRPGVRTVRGAVTALGVQRLRDILLSFRLLGVVPEKKRSILIKEYPPLEQVDVSRFAVEMDTLAWETRALVTSIYRN